MKTKLFIFSFLMISIVGFAQITTTRMNDLKIGMSPTEIFKLLGKKPAALSENYENIVNVNGVNYSIIIGSGYLSKNESDTYLKSISTKNKNVKTLSGIRIGSSLDDLWNAYGSKYDVYLSKEDLGIRYFRIQDSDNGTMLIFTIKKDVVTEIVINSYNPEECTL